jgi:hypothetical protein
MYRKGKELGLFWVMATGLAVSATAGFLAAEVSF